MNGIGKYFSLIVLAVLIRLLLMPFLFHPDIKTQYFHANFLNKGVLNIYQHIEDNKKTLSYTDTFNYPPLIYFLQGSWTILANPILEPQLSVWLSDWGNDWFTNNQIFRLLFVLKLPYLILDILIGVVLISLVQERLRRLSLILWFFNPITIYIIYGLSNFDIIPVLFSLLSLLFFNKQKYFTCGIFLGLGIATKLFPIIYLPFFIMVFIRDKNNKKAIRMLMGVAISVGVLILPLLPSFINILRNDTSNKASFIEISILGFSIPIFYILYIVTLILSFYSVSHKRVSFYILVSSLLLLATAKIHPQWFIWALPFLVLFLVEDLKLLVHLVPLIIGYALLILAFNDRFLTLGILSPVFPQIYDVGFLEESIFNKFDQKTILILGQGIFLLGTLNLILNLYKVVFNERK